MKRPSLAEIGRFLLIFFGVLLIAKLGRMVLLDGAGEELGGIVVVIAIAAGVLVTGGWLQSTPPST